MTDSKDKDLEIKPIKFIKGNRSVETFKEMERVDAEGNSDSLLIDIEDPKEVEKFSLSADSPCAPSQGRSCEYESVGFKTLSLKILLIIGC